MAVIQIANLMVLMEFILKEAIKNHCEMIRDSTFLKWRFLKSPVWQAHWVLPGHTTQVCRHAPGGRVGQVRRLLRRMVRRGAKR